ncbi:putative transcription factor & chromatin remodeling ARID family [Helianthus annuus]|uniref:Transcription factor & chromatin remodeling ARID family n=1 Tax=Helianthus annuus TaxID=4232 RepID=A0A9K3HZ58_HELAN|nr:putative transcription factor & chromatin remodeling ARID family [Helianthus annuus]KAJ0697236.1 putative transcription factor & chromatin remodeling ARID family [Helianthus annuus]KAJ0880109.1 putative transcription factor & chromatin remodeling ARID family [Helianthus annuus]
MILQKMKFKEFLDCKALLDMMDDGEYVRKYKFILQTKFDEMYLIIEREGGHRYVTKNNIWPMIAKEMGFEYSDGELMRRIYAMYLDVLVYYHKFKTVQLQVHDKELTEEKTELGRNADPRSNRSEGDAAEKDAGQDIRVEVNQVVTEDPSLEHYALFTNNGWHENKRRHTRRRFDFNRARAAMDDANESVLKYSHKQNHV